MMFSSGRGGAFSKIEWLTVGLIVMCYGSWSTAGLVIWPEWPIAALFLLTLANAFHSSLVHEALHGHPTRRAKINEALVFIPIGLIWPYRRYKAIHLRHHADERLTDPFDDPESYYKALWHFNAYPRWFQWLLGVNNTLIGRMIFGPVLGFVALVVSDLKAIAEGDRKILQAWVLHFVGAIPVIWTVAVLFDMPVWLYVLIPVWAGQSLISIRTYAEHQWSERPDGRTIIVERSVLAPLFLNNNLHLVHHKYPSVPWYRLPELYQAEREGWADMNGGYVFRNYLLIFLSFALKQKEPVAHPILRRVPEHPQAVSPNRLGHLVPGSARIEVPAKPQKD